MDYFGISSSVSIFKVLCVLGCVWGVIDCRFRNGGFWGILSSRDKVRCVCYMIILRDCEVGLKLDGVRGS